MHTQRKIRKTSLCSLKPNSQIFSNPAGRFFPTGLLIRVSGYMFILVMAFFTAWSLINGLAPENEKSGVRVPYLLQIKNINISISRSRHN